MVLRALKKKKKKTTFQNPRKLNEIRSVESDGKPEWVNTMLGLLPETPLQRVAMTAPVAQITNQRGRVFYLNCQP